MNDKQDETSLACILNELRKSDAEELAIPGTECYSLKSGFDLVKCTFDPMNSSNDENARGLIQELAPSTSSKNSIGNVKESTLEDNRIEIIEEEAKMSSLLSLEMPLNETEPMKLIEAKQFRKRVASVNEALNPKNLKKQKESNRESIFKRKLKSLHPVGNKKSKNADDNYSASLEIPSQPSNKLVKCLYSLGEIVWAKIAGYSHWPAMIDEDPDIRWHFWPTNSSSPTHYHVVFFDTNDRLSRSWVKTGNIKVFTEVIRVSSSRPKEYIERFKKSVNEAKIATKMTLRERLKKYSFKERINLPGIKLCQD